MKLGRAEPGFRSRLPFRLLLAMAPLALGFLLLRYFDYSHELDALNRARLSSTVDFAQSVDEVLRGAAAETRWRLEEVRRAPSPSCGNIVDAPALGHTRIISLVVFLASGDACLAGGQAPIDKAVLAALFASLKTSAAPLESADAGFLCNYGLTTASSGPAIAVYSQLRADGADSSAISALSLVSLDRLVSLRGTTERGAEDDALISDGRMFFRLLGGPDRGQSPSVTAVTEDVGRSLRYVSAPIGTSSLRVELAYDARGAEDLRRRFYLSFVAFLILLFLTWLAILYFANHEIASWVRGLAEAMPRRSRATGTLEFDRLSSVARPELREVVAILDEWAGTADRRERDLRSSLDANQKLIRELHHRVKNSLQVIQSYLALSRRENDRSDMGSLLDAEARVRVLSIAYRLALTEHGMEPVRVKPFIAEVVSSTTAAMRRPGLQISTELLCDAQLSVDRAIPLGLAVVEALIAAMRGREAARIDVEMWEARPGVAAISVKSDGGLSSLRPSARIMAGLAEQLRAHVFTEDAREVLDWEFSVSSDASVTTHA